MPSKPHRYREQDEMIKNKSFCKACVLKKALSLPWKTLVYNTRRACAARSLSLATSAESGLFSFLSSLSFDPQILAEPLEIFMTNRTLVVSRMLRRRLVSSDDYSKLTLRACSPPAPVFSRYTEWASARQPSWKRRRVRNNGCLEGTQRSSVVLALKY